MSSSEQTVSLTIVSSNPTLVDESTQTTPSTESSVSEEREVLPWTADEELAMNEANEDLVGYVQRLNEEERHEEEVRRILEQDERDQRRVEAEERDLARQTLPSPTHSRSPSPPPLIDEGTGIIFPDRETYLTAPVSYLMGLIEGTPNNEFVSGPTRPEVTRALEILREERSFVMHAQRSLQIREGTLIARINAGERRLMGLDHARPLHDAFHPADDYYMPTTAVVSRSSSSASNGSPLRPMPGAYVGTDIVGPRGGVYRFTRRAFHYTPPTPAFFGLHPRGHVRQPLIEYDSSDESERVVATTRPNGF